MELGAAFFFDRLIDADPASNTLSWRWVAGLHTQGKAYLADAERIAAMTDGRFSPGGLARTAVIPSDSLSVPQPAAVRPVARPDPAAATLLLVTPEDLSMETEPALRALPVQAVAVIDGRNDWDRMALDDGVARACAAWPEARPLGVVAPADLSATARAAGCTQIATAFLPVGPVADVLGAARQAARPDGLVVTEVLRDWDRRTWPHCRKGFFALRKRYPDFWMAGYEMTPTLTVYFDGACPLCRREIALMRRLDRRGAIDFVDVSDAATTCPIDRAALLARFHASENGRSFPARAPSPPCGGPFLSCGRSASSRICPGPGPCSKRPIAAFCASAPACRCGPHERHGSLSSRPPGSPEPACRPRQIAGGLASGVVSEGLSRLAKGERPHLRDFS